MRGSTNCFTLPQVLLWSISHFKLPQVSITNESKPFSLYHTSTCKRKPFSVDIESLEKYAALISHQEIEHHNSFVIRLTWHSGHVFFTYKSIKGRTVNVAWNKSLPVYQSSLRYFDCWYPFNNSGGGIGEHSWELIACQLWNDEVCWLNLV